MVVGLGCEKRTYDMVLSPEDITPENTLTPQEYAGHDAMMDAILAMAEKKLQNLNRCVREELPLSELLIGMQCGRADAFSGLAANPSAGYDADMIVKGGATVLFSEVTEVRDSVHPLPVRSRPRQQHRLRALAALALGKALCLRFPPNERPIMEYGTLITNSGFAGLPVVSGAYGSEGLFLGSLFIIPTRVLM